MKNLKKIASLALALIMALAMMAPALATDVTITAPTLGEGNYETTVEDYKAYKIFDASVDGEVSGTLGSTFGSVGYTIASDSPFISIIQNFKNSEGKVVFKLTEILGDNTKKNVTLQTETVGDETKDVAFTADDAKSLADALRQQTLDGSIGAIVSTPGTGGVRDAKLSLSDPGYYLIVGSLGTNAILDTVGKEEATIAAKNNLPTLDSKEVVPNTDGTNQPKVGDDVTFKITITAKQGTENYVVHDTMGSGLDFKEVKEVKVKDGNTLTKGADYTVVSPVTDSCAVFDDDLAAEVCDFHVVFVNKYLNTITTDTQIEITYTATINDEAVISVDKRTNTAKLQFGDPDDKITTKPKEREVPLYEFDLVKTDTNKKVLQGAKFKLYDAETGGNQILLIKDETNNSYRPADEDEKETANANLVIEAGIAKIKGLGAGTYYLEETEAPEGYNKLEARQAVTLSEATGNLTATFTDDLKTQYNVGGAQVVNKNGAELPSTGGIGTTIFYLIGGILVAGAAILLVTRKRVREQ